MRAVFKFFLAAVSVLGLIAGASACVLNPLAGGLMVCTAGEVLLMAVKDRRTKGAG